MKKQVLSVEQVRKLVGFNRYKVEAEMRLVSRCIDGRYQNKFIKLKVHKVHKDDTETQLPPVAVPGADAGDLALIVATGNAYGFEVDINKAYKVLAEIVGGEKNLQFHTDSHACPEDSVGAEEGPVLGGCGHFKQMTLDPKAYHLEKDQVEAVKKKFSQAKKKGAEEVVLHGEHMEEAVLLLSGPYSVYPRFKLGTDEGSAGVEVFVYHQSLSHERYKILAGKLIKNKAVKLYNGLDHEYLYQALSETAENHLMETAKRLARGLPIYQVKFKDDEEFEVKEMGCV